MAELPGPGGKDILVNGIADKGEIVGTSQATNGGYQAFLYKNGIVCGWANTANVEQNGVNWDAKGIHNVGAINGGKPLAAFL